MNGYVCFYRGMKIEINAPTSYAAQLEAAAAFRAKKSYEVTVVLAELRGRPILAAETFDQHDPAILDD